MRLLYSRLACIAGVFLFASTFSVTANEATRDAISKGMTQIEGVLPSGAADDFSTTLAAGDSNLAAGLGHVFFAKRHFDAAGWMFGAQALSDETQAAALSNYAAMIAEVYADAPDVFGTDFLMSGVLAAQDAVALDAGNAAYQNNLSRVALDAGLLDVALAAARAAVENAPDNALFLTNLARALEASGAVDEAAETMSRAHALQPAGMSYLTARSDLSGNAAYSNASSSAARPQCDVNFKCQEICPRSIIGGLMSVTCEMENSSAQMACAAGQPYPISYDCREDLPEYGILIPGLNSGFSIGVPGFSAHVLVDGQGNVDVRVEAGVSAGPIGGFVRADGHYSPSNGVAVDNMGGGVRLNLINGGRAGEIASGLGHPPAHIEMETLNGEPPVIALEAFNAPVITN